MESIILIAAPAAGKGTLAHMIHEQYHIPHISTGDLLREAASGDTEEAKQLAEELKTGHLIDDKTILHLLSSRIIKADCRNGYILDGFPRDIEQAKAYEEILEKLNKPLGKVIYIEVSEEVLLKRITGRRTCPICHTVYNEFVEESKPRVAGICDDCHESLIKRTDDNFETFQIRFQTYLENTKPLLDYYQQKGNLYCVNNNISKELAFNEIEKILTGGINND